jgi:hypothetical protein
MSILIPKERLLRNTKAKQLQESVYDAGFHVLIPDCHDKLGQKKKGF